MDLREPAYIAALARHKSITRAAEELGVSQPSLSRFLSATEKRYGIRFFDRIGKKLAITPAGREYFRRSQEILSLSQQLQDCIRDLASRDGGQVSVAITPSRGRYVLPNILPAFHNRFPDCQVEIHEGNVREVAEMLESGLVNVGLFLFDGENDPRPSLRLEEICQEEILLCVSRSSPYPAMGQWRKGFRHPWIDIRKLNGEIVLATSDSMRISSIQHKLLAEHEIHPYTITTSDLDLNISLAAHGFGVCFCTEICADYCYTVTRPFFLSVGETPARFSFVAAYHKDAYLPEAARVLIDITKRVFSKDRTP